MKVTFPQREVANPEVRVGWLAEAWMKECGFETFREVTIAGRRIDLVGRCGNVIWVMECKVSPSMALMEQAWHWRGRANLVTLVSPLPSPKTRDMLTDWCRHVGLGWLKTEAFDTHGSIEDFVRTPYRRISEFNRKRWKEILRDEHKSYSEAGARVGGWTPFKGTRDLVESVVLRSPGITMQALIKEISGKHHYRSDEMALRAIPSWINLGKMPNLRLSKSAGKWQVWHISQQLL